MLHGRLFLLASIAVLSLVSACSSKAPTGPSEAGANALAITAQPQSQTVAPGASTTLSVEAAGPAPMTFQWFVGGTGETSFEDAVLSLVNERRAAGASCGGTTYPGVGAMSTNGSLRVAARDHSRDMGTTSYFSHTSLDGRTYTQRMVNAGYSGSGPYGENIGAGYGSAAAVVNGWLASTGHCQNIMNGSFRAAGVGYAYVAGSTYGHYWTLKLGGS
jgi:uncharacterized protein YkwD